MLPTLCGSRSLCPSTQRAQTTPGRRARRSTCFFKHRAPHVVRRRDSFSGQAETKMTRISPQGRSEGIVAVPEKIPVAITVNGVARQLKLAPWTTLLDNLRD